MHTIENPEMVRMLANDPNWRSIESRKAASDNHKYQPGDDCLLVGLEDFPEFNGTPVKITAIRENGSNGKAYYVEGEINNMLNWVYEYRLIPNTHTTK